jgi:hypothetical protein
MLSNDRTRQNPEFRTFDRGQCSRATDWLRRPEQKKRSIDDENEIDKKRGSGGLDSLGGGRLP